MQVALFIPCYIDLLYPDIGISTYNILKKFGAEVYYPEKQTCCGQPAFNTGYFEETKKLALKFFKDFKDAEYIVAPSGSCVTMVKELYKELKFNDKQKEDWQNIAGKIYELTQFLVNVMKIDKIEGELKTSVTYHDSCHLLRELRVKDEPRLLLNSIDGLKFIEMEKSDVCCGFGGTFAVKYADISTAMVENKVHWALESGAEVLTGCDVSCLMNIGGYIKRMSYPIKVEHIANLIWKALEKDEG
ncbi:MAG: (Fe-S)-binding protein [Calditrichia bacterium]|nr:(Fe-S)-binding protein [Calditrichia bacterium]